MGQAVSCVDASREHPPYSWPKDHPGRAAAIELIKQRKAEGKPVGSIAHFAPGARRVYAPPQSTEKPLIDEPTEVVESSILSETQVAESPKQDNVSSDTKVPDEKAAVEGTVEEEAPPTKDSQGVESESEDKTKESTEKELIVEDSNADVLAISEAGEGTTEEVNVSPEEKKVPLSVDEATKIPDGDLKLDTLQKAHFSDEVDKLPEAKEVGMLVRDPITNDMVSQEEFRSRVKTRGVVSKQVSKFETIDEKAAMERAEYDAQHQARSVAKKVPAKQ